MWRARRHPNRPHQRPRRGNQRQRNGGGDHETAPQTRAKEALVAVGIRDVPKNRRRAVRSRAQARQDLLPHAAAAVAGEIPTEIVVGEEEKEVFRE